MHYKYLTRAILLVIISSCVVTIIHGRGVGLIVSKGLSKNVIKLSWNSIQAKEINILRSDNEDGPYIKLTSSSKNSFLDNSAEHGVKYWYRLTDDTGSIISADYGFTRPSGPQGLMPDEILKTRTKRLPDPRDNIERKTWDLHLSVIDDYYENYIAVSIIIFIGKMYILKGDLIAFRDFTNYTIDYQNKTIMVNKNGMKPIKFYSKRLFRFLSRCKKNNINENEILPRLINNAIFFCVRRGNEEITGSDNKVRLIPVYEALGMSTEYFRDCIKWRSNSIVFGSDTRDLEELIEKNRRTRIL